MSQWRHTRLVAGWEFRRYFKWRDQLLGLVIFLVIAAVSWGVGKFTSGRRIITIATAGFEITAPERGRLRFVPAPEDSTERATQLENGDLVGILTRRVDGSFDLLVKKDPPFLPDLRALVGELVRRERLTESGLSVSRLEEILAAPVIGIRFVDPERQRAGRAERVIAAIFIGIVMLAVFTSMAYLLTGITGEKQLRVTESITSIISPQAWIDGKILGIGAYSLATTLNMVIGSVLVLLVARATWDISIPRIIVRVDVILVLVIFSALGLALWNAAFAAFASTIDDPNTSARTSVMFVPFIPVAMTISVLRDPDHVASRVLSLFPLTSPSAMPVRMILSNPGLLEIGLAIGLLVATIWMLRRLAGRVFEIGMLMYGKEPTFSEIWRWARTGTR